MPEPGASASDARYRQLVEAMDDAAVFLLDADGHVVSWNRGAERIKGYRADEIVGKHFSVFYSPEANAVGHPQSELEVAGMTGRYAEEGWRLRKDGSLFWADVVLLALRAPDGSVDGFGKFTRDLTERLRVDQQASNSLTLLRTTVRTDPLTGLLNRRGLGEELAAAVERGRPFCVAMLDVDGFKGINDRLGHSAGDDLLRRVAGGWRSALRVGDVLARHGGDEFALLMPGCGLLDGGAVAERLRAITPPECTSSAGVAEWTPGMTMDEVLGEADRRLYEAKTAGRDRLAMRRSG